MHIRRSTRKGWTISVVAFVVISIMMSGILTSTRQSGATVQGTPLQWQQVVTGDYHSCAIASDGNTYCWGGGWWGQLGNGATNSHFTPVRVSQGDLPIGVRFTQLTAGYNHTCALASDNKVYCWGSNNAGQLGDSSTADRAAPTRVAQGALSAGYFTQVSAGAFHTCALASDNKAYCWGDGGYGRLGNNGTTNTTAPTRVVQGQLPSSARFTHIASGNEHTCALASNNKVYCWGNSARGQLGNNTTTARSTPVLVAQGELPTSAHFTVLNTYNKHTCALATDNKAYCWGEGSQGRLGNNDTADRLVPTRVAQGELPTSARFTYITPGNDHTCALASNNKTYCWGNGDNGRLGNNGVEQKLAPSLVAQGSLPSGSHLTKIKAGNLQNCAIASTGQAYCWGIGHAGRLGNGTQDDKHVPTAVQVVLPVVSVSQNVSRVYRSSITVTPGSPFAETNVIANLPDVGSDFRVRIGIGNESIVPFSQTTIPPNSMKLRLQYAQKPATGQCSAIPGNSWQDVTGTSPLAYAASGPVHGATVQGNYLDPTLPHGVFGYDYQSIVRPTGSSLTFTNNNSIGANRIGLWDVVLTDRSLAQGQAYCLRIRTDAAAAPGTSIDTYANYPEVRAATGQLGIRFTNAANLTLSNPTTYFGSIAVPATTTMTSAHLSNAGSQQLEVSNTRSSGGWTVSLSASDGPTGRWRNATNTASYPFNSRNRSRGQLGTDTSAASFAAFGDGLAGQGCDTTGLSFGAGASFRAGTATASTVTIATAAANSKVRCAFKLRNIRLMQTIPAHQKNDTYTLPMTLTVIAQ